MVLRTYKYITGKGSGPWLLRLFFLWFFCLSCLVAEGYGANPVIMAGQGSDGWARQWQQARMAVAAGNYEQGRSHYQALLQRLPALQQARWEYAQLLIRLEQWQEAEYAIELLLEADDGNDRYRQALGGLMSRSVRSRRAIELLGPGWQAGSGSFAHGEELYRSLMAEDRRQEALAVLETLHYMRPDDNAIGQQLFNLYVEQGKDQQAQPLATRLAAEQNPALLLAIARLHMRLDLNLLAAEYWQQLLRLDPSRDEAHLFLAANYQALGREQEALPHLHYLLRKNPADGQVARQIGLIHFRARKYEQAIVFFEQYRAGAATDPGFLVMLASCYDHQGELAKASEIYRHYLALVDNPTTKVRLQAAETFEGAGHYGLAAYQYRILEEATPQSYLLPLARLHSLLDQHGEALDFWLRIAQRYPKDVESRRAAVALLAKLDRPQERLVLLRQLHLLTPADVQTTLQLVLALIGADHGDEAWHIFEPLIGRELFSAPLLTLRGHILQKFALYGHAFVDLREAVEQEGFDQEARLYLLGVAGEMGQLVIMRQQAELLAPEGRAEPGLLLAIAEAYVAAGDLAGAMALYQRLWQNPAIAYEAHLAAANMYIRFGLPFEAEEQLRLAWALRREDKVLLALVELMLRQHEFQAAEGWLAGLERGSLLRSIYELHILNGYDQGEDVVELGEELLATAVNEKGRREILLQVARAYLGMGEEELCRDMLLQLIAADRYYAPAYIELVYLYEQMGERQLALQTGEDAVKLASYDAGLLLELLKVSRQTGLPGLASQAARALVKIAPDSFGFRLLLVQTLEENGEYDEAVFCLRSLAVDHGEESVVLRLGARLALAQGQYSHGRALLAKLPAADIELQVLQARLLWGDNDWAASLEKYADIISPPAAPAFAAACVREEVALPAPPEKSVWVRLVPLAGSSEGNLLARVLTPAFGLAKDSTEVNSISSGFVATFRWQRVIAREHRARQAVEQREYFHAVRQYELLVAQQADPTLAFDLAGVYSQLGRVGDEAMIYEQIQHSYPDFPGLASAMGRNRLKRRPRSGVRYSWRQEEGWAGHKDINEQRVALLGWLNLRPRDQLQLEVDHIYYSALASEQDQHGHEVSLSYGVTLLNHLRFQLKGGRHDVQDGSANGIYQLRMTGLAGDSFEGYIDLERTVVTDTMESVEQGIARQGYELGMAVDFLPRLQAIWHLFHRTYSDSNEQSGYGIDLAYILLPEPNFFRLGFSYEYTDSQDGSASMDHPYWAPGNYWRNDFSTYYKHRFSNDVLGRATPGFVAVEYRLGHDSTGHAFHYGELALVNEVSESWALEVTASMQYSTEYQANNIAGQLVYRW